MNKIQKNQKGFTAIEGLLIILILVVIGAVAYMVYHNNHKTTVTTITTTSNHKAVNSTKKDTASPYTGWNAYTLPKEKLTFRYPTNWTVENNFTDANNDGIQLTSKTDSSFEILVGAGPDISTSVNGGDCVQQSDSVTFAGQKAYLDFEGFSNTNTTPPSCSPTSSTIRQVLLSNSSTTDNANDFFLTKNIPQPAASSVSQIVVSIDYHGPNGSNTNNNKTMSQIESDTDYKDAELVVNSMSY